jgi:chemotaxis protein CheC
MDYINRISFKHLDVLKEVGNIGAGHSATSLSKLLNKKVEMTVPNVKIVSFNELMEWLGGPEVVIASVFLRIEGDIPGSLFFVLSIEQAESYIKELIADDNFSLRQSSYDEIGISAFQELGNILTGSYLSALSDLTELNIYHSVPALSIDMFGAVISHGLIELSHVSDFAIIVETVIKEEDQNEVETVKGHFFLLPDPNSFKKLFDTLGVTDEG